MGIGALGSGQFMTQITISRRLTIPDPIRVARYRRAPDLGPRLLFFSGGTALKEFSRHIKSLTENTLHFMSPFDSGGSSAELRRAFDMLSLGDLRNRLVSLANESVTGNRSVVELFSHRLSAVDDALALNRDLERLIAGDHPLMVGIPSPMSRIIRSDLRRFQQERDVVFDLRGASIGNLLLARGYLHHDRDIDLVLFLFSKLLDVRGVVRPIVDANLHLAATLADGSQIIGQHLMTGKECDPINIPIKDLCIVKGPSDPTPVHVTAPAAFTRFIKRADLICLAPGSFYTSLIANLLPRGVGQALAGADCLRVYVPSLGVDPEVIGLDLASMVETLCRFLRKDAGDVRPSRLIDLVIVDLKHGEYGFSCDPAPVEKLGIRVLNLPIAEPLTPTRICPGRLSDVLLSIAA